MKLGIRQVDTSVTGTAQRRNPAVCGCLPVTNLQTICDSILAVFPNHGRCDANSIHHFLFFPPLSSTLFPYSKYRNTIMVPLDPTQRHLLRKFLTEQRPQALTEAQINVIRSLPIFLPLPKWGERAAGEQEFIALLGSDMHLPNPAFDLRGYGPNFLQVYNDHEAAFIRALGISEISKTKFLHEFVFPKLEEIPAEIRDDVMLRCVKNLTLLQAESPEFFNVLCETKFVTTPSGRLLAPNQISTSPLFLIIVSFFDICTYIVWT